MMGQGSRALPSEKVVWMEIQTKTKTAKHKNKLTQTRQCTKGVQSARAVRAEDSNATILLAGRIATARGLARTGAQSINGLGSSYAHSLLFDGLAVFQRCYAIPVETNNGLVSRADGRSSASLLDTFTGRTEAGGTDGAD